ncbi:MAG: IS66 family transposase [Thermoanaerobaculia bacterium]|nr:IS66 family transposase [Thermoanaerobaculia bacterium]
MKRSDSRDALIERLLKKIEKLEARLEEQSQRIEQQSQRISQLESELAKARKNSSTSSKPPSSDIVKPPGGSNPPKKKGKRKKGGQPGHPRHEREPFGPDEIDEVHDHLLDCCPDCGTDLLPGDDAPRVVQQVEIIETPIWIEEHRAHARWCPGCQKVHYHDFPAQVEKRQLAGPRLTALVAYMKGMCHASFSTIRKFLRDVVGVPLSRGYLRKLVEKVSVALDGAYDELLEQLPLEAVLNVDETGHKENGEKFWTWCFRAQLFTLFRIDKSRGSDVLFDVLGEEFDGVLGCDYFSAYRKFMGDCDVRVQFCLAHLIRDVRFLTTLSDKVTKNYGERVLDKLRGLFRVIHRREELKPSTFERRLQKAREELVTTAKRAPQRSEAQNLAARFREHGDAYFEFITTPGIDPTNNIAERAIRFVVIDRKVTQGTRAPAGRRWNERIWTAIATCTQLGRSVFEFLYESVAAHFEGRPGPSLAFDSS